MLLANSYGNSSVFSDPFLAGFQRKIMRQVKLEGNRMKRSWRLHKVHENEGHDGASLKMYKIKEICNTRTAHFWCRRENTTTRQIYMGYPAAREVERVLTQVLTKIVLVVMPEFGPERELFHGEKETCICCIVSFSMWFPLNTPLNSQFIDQSASANWQNHSFTFFRFLFVGWISKKNNQRKTGGESRWVVLEITLKKSKKTERTRMG